MRYPVIRMVAMAAALIAPSSIAMADGNTDPHLTLDFTGVNSSLSAAPPMSNPTSTANFNQGTGALTLSLPTNNAAGFNFTAGAGTSTNGGAYLSNLGVDVYGNMSNFGGPNREGPPYGMLLYFNMNQDPSSGVQQQIAGGWAIQGGTGKGFRRMSSSGAMVPDDGFSWNVLLGVEGGSRTMAQWTGIGKDGLYADLDAKLAAQYCFGLGGSRSVLLCPKATGQFSPNSDNQTQAQLQGGVDVAGVLARSADGRVKSYVYGGITGDVQEITTPGGSVVSSTGGFKAGAALF